MPAIRLQDLTVGYDQQPALRQVSGSFEAGSLTAVMGPNGAGKTTLLKAISGLLQPPSGRVELVDADRDRIAYLPQQAEIDRSFPISVQDVVGLGHWRRTGAFRPIGPRRRGRSGGSAGAGRPRGLRLAADRQPVRRAVPARPVRPADRPGLPDRSCSTNRSRRSMRAPPPTCSRSSAPGTAKAAR